LLDSSERGRMTDGPRLGSPAQLAMARSTLGSVPGFAALLAGSAVGRLLSFITGVALARQLSPSAFGEFSIFFGVLIIVFEGTNFIDFTYVRYANTSSAAMRVAHLRGALVLKCGFLLMVVAAAYPLGSALAAAFNKPDLDLMLGLALVTGALMNVVSLKVADYLADERFLRLTVVNTIYNLLVLVVFLVVIGLGVPLTRAVLSGVFLAAAVPVAGVCFARLYSASKRLSIEPDLLRVILRFAKWLAAANLAYLLAQRLDLFILSRYASLSDVGNYGAALRVVVLASIMTGALPALLLPRASRTAGSISEARRFTRHALGISVLVTVVTVIMWLAVPLVVHGLLGSDYSGSIQLTRILLIGTVFAAFSTPLSQLFLAEERPKKAFYFRMIKLGGVFALALLLVPYLGARGAAWAVTGSELIVLAYTVIALWPILRYRPAFPKEDADPAPLA
jgi:O-antigen/teichoic acid export membrane protein